MYTVLLIDDKKRNTALNKAALQWYKYEVMQAYTISEADKLLKERIPDLIVLNVNLPDGSGLDYCRKLKAGYRLTVILLSEKGSETDILAGLRAGADDYIVIPYDLSVFIARIEVQLKEITVADSDCM